MNRNVPQYFLQDVFLLKNHLTVEYNSHKIIKKSLMWSVQDTCICTLDRPLITRSRSRIWQSTFDSKASSKISSSVRCLKMLNIQNDDFLRASVRHNVWFWPLLYSLNYVLGYFISLFFKATLGFYFQKWFFFGWVLLKVTLKSILLSKIRKVCSRIPFSYTTWGFIQEWGCIVYG